MAVTTTAVNIRLPQEVLDILDTLVERKLFANRSEAIREFCRDYLRERQDHETHAQHTRPPNTNPNDAGVNSTATEVKS